jgi:hypothetical protein
MQKTKNGVDVIDKVLNACYEKYSDSLFIMGMMHNYEERGWLTRKQLVGLHEKASKIKDLSPGWLAAIEVMIKRLPVKDKTPAVNLDANKVEHNQSDYLAKANEILEKYPQHKAIISFKAIIEMNKPLTSAQQSQLNKLHKLLLS